MLDPVLTALIGEAWRIYQDADANPLVVRPSIPLPYWGDAEPLSRICPERRHGWAQSVAA